MLRPSRTALLFALLLGCRHQPLPVLEAPAVSARTEAVPELPLSTLTIPLSVPLAALSQVIQERLHIPDQADWRTVTGEGDKTEVAIRYQAEVGDARLVSQGNTLHTTLPIRYYGSFRAHAQTPFGSFWLTKNTRWGSREQPGVIELTVSSALSIGEAWQLSAQSVLTRVALTAPPVEKLCAGKVFKVCVPVDMVKGLVHKQLGDEVRARAEPALAQLDAEARERLDLQGLARAVWGRLQAGFTADGQTLLLTPEGMSLGYPTVIGDEVVAELRVWARPRFLSEDSAPAGAVPPATPLPAPRELGPTATDVHLTVRSSLSDLGNGLSAALTHLPETASGYRITQVALLGAAESPQRYLLSVTLSDAERAATAYGEAALLLDQQSVGLSDVQLFEQAAPLLSALGTSNAELAATLGAVRHSLAPALDERLGQLRGLLASSVQPWPANTLRGARAALQAAYASGDDVTFTVRAQ